MSFSFDDIADLLLSVSSNTSPAELHGQLCGQLALGFTPSDFQWLRQLADTTGVNFEAGSRISEDFIEWLHAVQAQIRDEDFGFELFLPDDEESLEVRLDELATWCSAFMSGVAMVNANTTPQSLEEDESELLNDIIAISTLDPDEPGEEADLDEILQYLRLGISQLCIDTLKKNQPEASEALH